MSRRLLQIALPGDVEDLLRAAIVDRDASLLEGVIDTIEVLTSIPMPTERGLAR